MPCVRHPVRVAALATVAFLLALVGCAADRTETIELREGLQAVDAPIHATYLQWAGERRDAGTLKQGTYDSCVAAVAQHDGLIAKSRSRDGKPAATQPVQ